MRAETLPRGVYCISHVPCKASNMVFQSCIWSIEWDGIWIIQFDIYTNIRSQVSRVSTAIIVTNIHAHLAHERVWSKSQILTRNTCGRVKACISSGPDQRALVAEAGIHRCCIRVTHLEHIRGDLLHADGGVFGREIAAEYG